MNNAHLDQCLIRRIAITLSSGLALIVLAMIPSYAFAHYCRLKVGDDKFMCLAQKEESMYFCRYVQQADKKQACIAGYYGDKNYCVQIQDSEQKARCEADAEARAAVLEKRRAQQAAQNLKTSPTNQTPQSQGN